MTRTTEKLREDALRIWQAGVDGVRSDRLVREALQVQGSLLAVGDDAVDLSQVRKIAVVGAGKAGAGMAAGVEAALGRDLMREKQLTGWVNVPADCVRPLDHIHLHAARPAGHNEPTTEGMQGTAKMLEVVENMGPDDLCLCLISGGGSALLPAPAEGITLEDKQAITQHLSAAGATIEQLNTVRKQLSRIKGGGLARACRAGRLITLIISDVLGDPLEFIASGPTVEDSTTPQDALAILEQFHAQEAGIRANVFAYLKNKAAVKSSPSCQVSNLVIGNNATAVDSAGAEAERLGYSHAMISHRQSEGAAEAVGKHLAEMALHMRRQAGPDCLISGGEPTVTLIDKSRRGRGGRNQQLVLSALQELGSCEGIALLSGGTDGEDGPTDAAGAIIDSHVAIAARSQGLDLANSLRRNDAYHFFQASEGLILTGPTHTNVCDLRVVLVDREELADAGR
jgi:hydroxypyruvate reductase